MGDNIFDDPADTREEILAATYRSLCEYGYAELSIQKIGEEFPKSPSLVYHHYDDKDDLVMACLDYSLAHLETTLTEKRVDSARAQLEELIEWAFGGEPANKSDAFMAALFELRSRSPYNDEFRRYFRRSDRVFETYIEDLIKAGNDSGEFDVSDPRSVAMTLQTMVIGAVHRRATTDDPADLRVVLDELEAYLNCRVYAP